MPDATVHAVPATTAATSGESDGCRRLVWVRPEHVGSMATTTTDDILAVYDDGAEDAVATLKSCAMSLEVMDTGS